VNSSFIIWHLCDVVAKGGLMQIGYGPDVDGEFHPLAVKALEETGDWLKVNGDAIYATRAMHGARF
jgi:alpha-L-fucosidase